MRKILLKKARASVVALVLLASIFSAPSAEALYKVVPATQWGHIYAGTATDKEPERDAFKAAVATARAGIPAKVMTLLRVK